MTTTNDSPIIWYIPGLFSEDDPQEKALMMLNTIYPHAKEVINVTWENQNGKNIILDSVFEAGTMILLNDSNPAAHLADFVLKTALALPDRWRRGLRDVIPTAELLANKIANLSSADQQRLILIGHSLGGNIVIRTLAHLYRRNITINSAVLLAAAIDNMNENILLAIEATREPVCSVVNPDDNALFLFQLAEGTPALGTGCELKLDRSKFWQRYTSKSSLIGHSSDFYLSQWAAAINDARKISDQVHVQQPAGSIFNIPVKTLDIDRLWTVVDQFMGWKLEKSVVLPSYYRILDSHLKHRAWSVSETEIKRSFNDIKEQIKKLIENDK